MTLQNFLQWVYSLCSEWIYWIRRGHYFDGANRLDVVNDSTKLLSTEETHCVVWESIEIDGQIYEMDNECVTLKHELFSLGKRCLELKEQGILTCATCQFTCQFTCQRDIPF